VQEDYWKQYPWYEIAEGDYLEQGDFIDDCKVLIPRYALSNSGDETASPDTSSYQVDGVVDTYNVIIVSQSCDLDNRKVDFQKGWRAGPRVAAIHFDRDMVVIYTLCSINTKGFSRKRVDVARLLR
jgi:hypothetical protein